MCCTIWCHLYNLKNVKNTHEGVLILVKLRAEACNFTKINSSSWVFFTFFELYKWYQIAQRTTSDFCIFQVEKHVIIGVLERFWRKGRFYLASV